MKKLLPFLFFLLIFLVLKSPSLALTTCAGGIGEGQTGCSSTTINSQGNCCTGLICFPQNGVDFNSMGTGVSGGICIKPGGTAPSSTTKPAGYCGKPVGDSCSTNDDCCSKLCSVDPNSGTGLGGWQKKCYDKEPEWPSDAECIQPNQVCDENKPYTCCVGMCYKGICTENIPAGDKPPPCSQWENGKCLKISTGLGVDMPTDIEGFVKSLLGIFLSISGGIALMLFIYTGIKIMGARGNPEKFQEARDRFTSTILGIIFIIFSLFILQLIGVDLLKIPGFSR
ncbi:hypothetical protein M1307_00460 [Patescibacteria group bacterium]|nr:hypothetical protein [Patescibacteria group bacterium]